MSLLHSKKSLVDDRYPALIDAAIDRGPVFESLEPRMLLSASLDGGVLSITGTRDADMIRVMGGHDAGQIVVSGVEGVDDGTVFDGVDHVTVDALDGNDKIKGNSGSDTIDAGDGRNRVAGGNGHDVIIGGLGVDRMRGGRGVDDMFQEHEDRQEDGQEIEFHAPGLEDLHDNDPLHT